MESNTIDLDKSKFLAPQDINVSQFLVELRKHFSNELTKQEGCYILTDEGISIPLTMELSDVYQKYKGDCGLLYLNVEKESIFG